MTLQIEPSEPNVPEIDSDDDDDVEPLVGKGFSKDKKSHKEWVFLSAAISSFISQHKSALLASIAASVILLFLLTLRGGDGDSELKEHATHGKVIPVEELIRNITVAKQVWYEQLQQDYGVDHFQSIFFDNETSRSRTAFLSPTNTDLSWNRLKTKLALKVLRVMTGQKNVQFVWATGGHSAAAGHGNFHDESYTAILQRDVQDIFASIGISFEGLNYAMGGTTSAPELAMCVSSIFGTKFDVLSWDFGMTDGWKYAAMQFYFYRALLGANRPATVTFMRGGDAERIAALRDLENKGASTLYLDHVQEKQIFDAVPDSFGLTQAQLDALPPMVRNFKCDNRIEEGEPFCDKEKFNKTLCPMRKFMVSWHPGYKWHALSGHLMSFLLLEVLTDALDDIQNSELAPAALLAELQSQDDDDYQQLLNSTVPSMATTYVLQDYAPGMDEKTLEVLYKKPNFCHTALLPAKIRYNGLLNNSADQPIDPLEMEQMQMPLTTENVNEIPNEGDTIRLIADMEQRQYCPRVVNIDHKDRFYIHSTEGQKELILPNDAEMNAYSHVNKLQGYVSFCLTRCWGDCVGSITNNITDGAASILINGEAVVGLAKMHDDSYSDCFLLHSSQGFVFTPNEQGQFKIQIHAKQENSYMRITSFVIW